jgi:hypothetical protein
MGIDRSWDKAYRVKEQLHPDSIKKAPRHWPEWAANYEWLSRCRAYDANVEKKRRKAAENENLKKLDAYQARSEKVAKVQSEIGLLGLTKLKAKIENIDVEKMTPGETAALLRAVSQCLTSSLAAEAEAIGVRELESLLDGSEGES